MTGHVTIRHPIEPDRVLFTHGELKCKVTGKVRLAEGFGAELARLRVAFGRAMIVNSCCRSAEHNASVGGHARSLHVYDQPHHRLDGAAAIDIAAPDTLYMRELLVHALRLGWSVGVGKGFVHLDRRDIAGLMPGAFGY